ncbi:MAG: DUF4199 domain-containing protein [Gemmatimonas sp.]|jgi:hypothetical protein|uniref:DUF4199 domain-containing protein n=1 Tax=Gemmatimonas sp. TaxID=1962908 RepID=UPI00391F081B|nr:DUF4199 domain-containing protein [Gemmatimonadota bacterium]
MRKIVWTFGLIAGAVMSVMLALTMPFQDQMAGNTGMIIGYTSMILASLMIYFGVRQYRDTVGNGAIDFWPAAKVGLLISAVAVVCYVLTWQVIYYGFYPDFAEKFAETAVERLRARGASEAELAAEVKRMAEFAAMYKNPLVNIAFTALEPLPVLLLFSGVSAAMLRRKLPAA